MIIGITQNHSTSFNNYLRWLQTCGSSVECVILSHRSGTASDLEGCDGLLLTGGGDVDPALYERSDAMSLVEDVDRERDKFELEVIERAFQKNLPMLCICRGMQIFNVAMGGTLIPDMRSAGYKDHRKGKVGDATHVVRVVEGTVFSDIVGLQEGTTNTNHHQAVDRCGDRLRVTARAPDGIVEVMEWEDAAQRPFLQLVQWHPERMKEEGNPFSRALLEAFITAVEDNSVSPGVRGSTHPLQPRE